MKEGKEIFAEGSIYLSRKGGKKKQYLLGKIKEKN